MALGLNHNQMRALQMNWVRPAELASPGSHAPAISTLAFTVLLSVVMGAQIIAAVLGADPLSNQFGLRSEIWSWTDPADYGRMVTYALLHVNAVHFVGNILLLLLVGSLAEWRLGVRVIGPLIIVGAIVAAMTHLLMFPAETRPLVGASGAISTLLGAATVVAGDVGIRIRLPFRSYWLSLTVRRLIVLWLLLQFAGMFMAIFSPSNPVSVAYWVHLAGYGVGLVAGAHIWKQRQARDMPALGEAYSIVGD